MKRHMPILIILVIIIIGVGLGISYINSTHKVTINYTHAHNVTIVSAEDTQDNQTTKPIKLIKTSGQSLRVPKTASYIVTYNGDNNYADGTVAINQTTDKITIDPDYSKEKYQQLIKDNSSDITQVITKAYPQAAQLYTIAISQMYHHGEWALIILKYNGEYNENSDTLKVLAHKDKTTWALETKPDITFNKYTYPKIPIDVLDSINDYQV